MKHTQIQQIVAVDNDRLDRIEAGLAALTRTLQGAMVTPAPEWITVRRAATQLDVSPDTIRRKIRSGEIESKGCGKTRLVRL